MQHEFIFPRLVLVAAALLLSVSAFAQTQTVLYNFQGAGDGSQPLSNLVADAQGNLYGTTSAGNTCAAFLSCGVVFQLTPPSSKGDPWKETVIYNFGSTTNDGMSPIAGLIFDGQGDLYGTTQFGGSGNCNLGGPVVGCGTVFKLSPPATAGGAWTETTLYSFQGGTADGRFPTAAVTLDQQGNLYGTTTSGGNGFCNGFPGLCGIAFRLSPPKTPGGKWTERILHNFGNGFDGQNPTAPLLLEKSGVLFGTTSTGGEQTCAGDIYSIDCGTVFELIPPVKPELRWTERFHSLGLAKANMKGYFPSAGLVQGRKGKLYGVTTTGGTASDTSGQCVDENGFARGCGVIFEVTPPSAADEPWQVITLYQFVDQGDGADPVAALTADMAGNLYGVTAGRGPRACPEANELMIGAAMTGVSTNDCGTVFKLSPPTVNGGSWTETTLYQFSGGVDGGEPSASLIPDGKGGFYGTTWSGGSSATCGYGCGTVFEITP